MAIVWSAQYPGQISTDPAWPHGKPRNVAVPGDGSGTPLEAAWVSDLAGWQAALLEEAGITPSGNPDNVGASDYTNAIKQLAQVEVGNFTAEAHVWSGQQQFGDAFASGDFGVGGEVLYVDPAGVRTPKLRTVRLPLSAWLSEIDTVRPDHIGWYLNPGFAGTGYQTGWGRLADADIDTGLYTEYQMPTGSKLESVVARVQGIPFGGDSSIVLSTGQTKIESDFLTHRTVEKSSGPLDGTMLLTVNAAADLPWLGPFDASTTTLLVRFTGIRSVAMNWVQISFWDPGPRNY